MGEDKFKRKLELWKKDFEKLKDLTSIIKQQTEGQTRFLKKYELQEISDEQHEIFIKADQNGILKTLKTKAKDEKWTQKMMAQAIAGVYVTLNFLPEKEFNLNNEFTQEKSIREYILRNLESEEKLSETITQMMANHPQIKETFKDGTIITLDKLGYKQLSRSLSETYNIKYKKNSNETIKIVLEEEPEEDLNKTKTMNLFKIPDKLTDQRLSEKLIEIKDLEKMILEKAKEIDIAKKEKIKLIPETTLKIIDKARRNGVGQELDIKKGYEGIMIAIKYHFHELEKETLIKREEKVFENKIESEVRKYILYNDLDSEDIFQYSVLETLKRCGQETKAEELKQKISIWVKEKRPDDLTEIHMIRKTNENEFNETDYLMSLFEFEKTLFMRTINKYTKEELDSLILGIKNKLKENELEKTFSGLRYVLSEPNAFLKSQTREHRKRENKKLYRLIWIEMKKRDENILDTEIEQNFKIIRQAMESRGLILRLEKAIVEEIVEGRNQKKKISNRQKYIETIKEEDYENSKEDGVYTPVQSQISRKLNDEDKEQAIIGCVCALEYIISKIKTEEKIYGINTRKYENAVEEKISKLVKGNHRNTIETLENKLEEKKKKLRQETETENLKHRKEFYQKIKKYIKETAIGQDNFYIGINETLQSFGMHEEMQEIQDTYIEPKETLTLKVQPHETTPMNFPAQEQVDIKPNSYEQTEKIKEEYNDNTDIRPNQKYNQKTESIKFEFNDETEIRPKQKDTEDEQEKYDSF